MFDSHRAFTATDLNAVCNSVLLTTVHKLCRYSTSASVPGWMWAKQSGEAESTVATISNLSTERNAEENHVIYVMHGSVRLI